VGRWGGDEFVVVLSGELTEEDATNKANDILNVMREPFQLTGNTLTVLISIGIAMSDNGRLNADRLLQHADIAMYQAKQHGRNRYQLFTEEMEEMAQLNFQIETAIPEAIKHNQFFMNYQPKVSCLTNEVVGFEALLRWKHPEYGYIPPNEFIPVIEGGNLIIDVGEWVISTVVKQLATWRQQGQTLLPVAINISGHHLHAKSLVPFIQKLILEHDIQPELIEVEITEGAITGNTKESIASMTALKSINIKLAVDDFGTGYSSLSYLKKFPVDILKIDRAFVTECNSNREDAAICVAIITLAKSLGLQTVAEGVETAEQLAFLKKYDCDIYQGFYFSHPLAEEHIPMLLQQGNSH
jgi:Amt family ammonium transporter